MKIETLFTVLFVSVTIIAAGFVVLAYAFFK